ncbi:hypothetical protein BPO_0054 [Bergeyella porcorum]|uniref:Uncharacterized protein n=1 Tax=Bergeyella porcorum TaxID=1735111 RepID=A0AAU0EYE0_9FLAO
MDNINLIFLLYLHFIIFQKRFIFILMAEIYVFFYKKPNLVFTPPFQKQNRNDPSGVSEGEINIYRKK